MSAQPIDIVVLSHDRLEHLVATVDALHARTPDPFRLTLVDNASDPDVRNWIVDNRRRFHQVILRPTNEHVGAFQHGIEATTSDPFIVTDPDLIVPELHPSWLARLSSAMAAHPDFGLIGLSIVSSDEADGRTLEHARHEPERISEGNVGTCFQMIRRDALREPYVKDSAACNAVREAGYRVGWLVDVTAVHVGAEDWRNFPAHLAAKNDVVTELVRENQLSPYPFYYAASELSGRPPTFEELADAAPVIAMTRAAGVPDSSVLELTWRTAPTLAAAVAGPLAVAASRGLVELRLGDRAVGAVVLVEPARGAVDAALAEAFRVAASLVVLVAPLEAVQGRATDELVPPGWTGVERYAASDLELEFARAADRLPLTGAQRFAALEHREQWLAFFQHGAFAEADRRLFVFTRDEAVPIPGLIEGADLLEALSPMPRDFAVSERAPFPARVRARLCAKLGRVRS